MKLMGWLDVKPQFEGLDAIVRDGPLAPKVQAAVDDILPNRLWRPDDPLHKPISRAAATAPGSVRKNDLNFFFEKFDDIVSSANACSASITRWSDQCQDISDQFYKLAEKYTDSLFNPGRTITAASDEEDEPGQPGFQATGPRDDFATHMSYQGLKPGTPEWDAEARAWVDRESIKRAWSNETERASRLMVRDANLKRYAMTDADRLIEEMMQ
jgi:hypothetical protein